MGEKQHFIGYSLRQKLNEIAGRAKPLAAFILICSGIFLVGFLCGAETDIRRMVANPDGRVKKIQITDIVDQKIWQSSFVSVAGTAFYDHGISPMEGYHTRGEAPYYLLVDPVTLDAVMVRSSRDYILAEKESGVSIQGILTAPEGKYRAVMRTAANDLKARKNIRLSTSRIIMEWQKPPNLEKRILILKTLAIWALFFFPSLLVLLIRVEPVIVRPEHLQGN